MPRPSTRSTLPGCGTRSTCPSSSGATTSWSAIRDHQVVVVAGETGSGKTTQLPKMCLELGLGSRGQVGHTQPRRIAARSVAERIAEEMEVELGGLVGYQVRFTDHSSDATRVKVMTDGILLAEMQRDRDLRRYDTLILDEAHERSLNIDFILGYLKQLLPRRPELKVVVTSATIDPLRFARHFATDERGEVVREVPVIEVSGRTYPVEVRYRPLLELHPDGRHVVAERDQVTGRRRGGRGALDRGAADPRRHGHPRVLLGRAGDPRRGGGAQRPGAARHRGASALRQALRRGAAPRLPPRDGRRIILATNVAETSLTVPGIGYVVDTGTARISRYSQRTKVQRLPIEPVSRASAAQRAGRCGRVAPGICIRLYSEEDFEARPEFTEPEIQRTSLASVILQMTSLGLGDVTRFPFVDPPDARQVADGVRLLEELSAFEVGELARGRHRGRGRRLTASGRTLARLPLDPRLARMVVEAGRLGCTREVLVLVAALSIQDPRERPVDKEAQADQSHARFKDDRSDFVSLHNLWRYLTAQQKALSHSAFRRTCKSEYLHYLRIREWQDLHSQLRAACRSVRIDPDRATAARDAEPDWDTVHRALLAGLLSHVGVRDEVKREYAGARGARFGISPGSALFRRQPDYVMAAELVETTRLWARVNARIQPEWAEEAGAHVVARTVSEPRWSRKAGAAVATERVTLYGVPLVTDRTIQYAGIDPEAAREIFVRSALVEGDWEPQHEFWRRNLATLRRVAELEERARRRDIVVDDEVLFAFYDSRIPPDVVSERHFDRWWRGERRRRPDLLTLTEEILTSDAGEEISAEDYPRVWRQGDLDLDVTYQFSPGSEADGVTVHVPVAVLNRVSSEGFDWQVPGLRDDLAVALLKSLPKATRRHFVPTPDHAMAALVGRRPGPGEPDRRDGSGAPRAHRRSHPARGMGPQPRAGPPADHLQRRGPGREGGCTGQGPRPPPTSGRRSGPRGDGRGGCVARAHRPHHVERRHRPGDVRGARGGPDRSGLPRARRRRARRYPSGCCPTAAPRRRLTAGGCAGCCCSARRPRGSACWRGSPTPRSSPSRTTRTARFPRCSRTASTRPSTTSSPSTCPVRCAPRRRMPPRSPPSAAMRPAGCSSSSRRSSRCWPSRLRCAGRWSLSSRARRRRAPPPPAPTCAPSWTASSDRASSPGPGLQRLRDVQRYLRAAQHRLERAATNPREAVLQETIDRVEEDFADLLESLPMTRRGAADVTDLGWMVEELRVSLFAQSLGTAHPVSEKRVRAAIAAVAASRH